VRIANPVPERAFIRLSLFHCTAIAFFLFAVALHYDPASGFTRFIYFGDHFTSTRLPEVTRTDPFVFHDSDGYDGQFYAQIATSPLLANPGLDRALDSPAYRSRRIGLPAFAWLAGLGHTRWILQAYALANVLAWLALAVLLLRWIPTSTTTARLAWLGCLFGVGVMMSVERALTDLPAALLLVIALHFAERQRRGSAGVAFSLALLTRDASMLGGGLLLPADRADRRQWLRAAGVGALAALPLVFWSIHVHRRFPGLPNGDAGIFALPFSALLGKLQAIWHAIPQQGWIRSTVQLLSITGLCVQFLLLLALARSAWRQRWWRVGAAFALLFAVLGPLVWEDYTAAARTVIPMTLAFNVLLLRDRWWSFPVCLVGNLPLLHGVVYLLRPSWPSLP